MPSDSKLDPAGERAKATEAMESTPISGKAHDYRADGDHRPRQDSANIEGGPAAGAGRPAAQPDAAPAAGVEAERHISEGIPGGGQAPEAAADSPAPRDRVRKD